MPRNTDPSSDRRGGRAPRILIVSAAAVLLILFAWKVTQSYKKNGMAMEDLLATAVMGMYRAAEKYEPNGVPFISYAKWWMMSALNRHVNKSSMAVSMPPLAIQGRALLRKVATTLDKSPLEVTEEDVREHHDVAQFTTSVSNTGFRFPPALFPILQCTYAYPNHQGEFALRYV